MKINNIGLILKTFALISLKCVLCDEVLKQEYDYSSSSEDTCEKEDTHKEEKIKYYIEKAREYYAAHSDHDEEMSDEDLKQILIGFRDKTIDIESIGGDIVEKEISTEDDSGDVETKKDVYEFPKLTVLTPGNVGDTRQVELEEGHVRSIITKSVLPPVFEIPNFLSNDECNFIIDSALKAGLNISNIFGDDIEEEFAEDNDLSEISRVSEQTWLREENLGSEFWRKLLQRVAKLTGLQFELIRRGEPIQVVNYGPGGHYHAHLDTVDNADHLPCCFQTQCGEKEHKPEWAECCRLCRFITVLYYLNEPEDGGETAFPFADMPEELVEEKFVNLDEQEWYNLSKYCHNSSLIVKPKRGTAIMWYSHFVDEQTGYLGKVDRRSHHGGCDLKKGSKWIANNWISGTSFENRFLPSMFYKDAE